LAQKTLAPHAGFLFFQYRDTELPIKLQQLAIHTQTRFKLALSKGLLQLIEPAFIGVILSE
jgi:hypothetical protein